MTAKKTKDDEALNWLMESENASVRYLAQRDLLCLAENDPNLIQARQVAASQGPIVQVLEAMNPDGWWEKPGPGYNPKYRSSVWAIILLAQLGASIKDDARVETACQYMLAHSLTKNGQFTASGSPSGSVDCLQGNLCQALLDLGVEDERLDQAFDWMARSQTGDGIAPATEKANPIRYYASKCGPGFKCGSNSGMLCAWGAVK